MTPEKGNFNYSEQRTDFYLKHIFRSVEQVPSGLITVDEIRRIKPPTKASNDPDGKDPLLKATCSSSSMA